MNTKFRSYFINLIINYFTSLSYKKGARKYLCQISYVNIFFQNALMYSRKQAPDTFMIQNCYKSSIFWSIKRGSKKYNENQDNHIIIMKMCLKINFVTSFASILHVKRKTF